MVLSIVERVVLFAAFSSFVLAQTSDRAAIYLRVTDPSHALVGGVQVTVSGGGVNRVAQTDSQGDLTVTALPVDLNYTASATKEGFAPTRLANVALRSGTTGEINLQLNMVAGSTQATVTGVDNEVRMDAPQLGDRIAGRQLEETPMLDRRISYLPLLNSANRPAINQGDASSGSALNIVTRAGGNTLRGQILELRSG